MDWEELLKLMTPQLAGGAGGVMPVGAQVEEPPQYLFPQPPLPVERMAQVRQFEGFNPNAYWDYGQYSIGHGTKSQPGERIDREEAQRRLVSELSSSRAFVNQRFPNVDPGTQDAVTSLHFNAGQKWANQGLGAALDRGNLPEAQQRFLSYNKAGGQVLPGLQSRRNVEAQWIGNPMAQSGQVPDWLIPQQQAAAGAVPVPVTATQESAQLAQQPRVPTLQVAGNPAAEGNVKPGSWSEALSNPATAAFFIGMGTHLMTGQSWQGGLSGALNILGHGIAGGVESAHLTDKNQDELFLKGAALDEKNEDRISRERVARIGAESREGVANIRGQFSMQRALAAGAKTPNDLSAYNAVYNTVYKTLTSENLLKPPEQQLTEQQIDGLAAQRAAAQWQSHQSLRGQSGVAGARNSEIPAGGTPAGGSQAGAKSAPEAENKAGDEQPSILRRALPGLFGAFESVAPQSTLDFYQDLDEQTAKASGQKPPPKRPGTDKKAATPAAPAAQPAAQAPSGNKPFKDWTESKLKDGTTVGDMLLDHQFRQIAKNTYPEYRAQIEAMEALMGMTGVPVGVP